MLEKVICITLGSIAGGLSRFFLAGWGNRFGNGSFPYGTVSVNLAACFLIGFFASLAEEKIPLGVHGKLLLMTGFCGAFTTFSAFILETDQLLKAGNALAAFANLSISLIVGYIFFCGGLTLGKNF